MQKVKKGDYVVRKSHQGDTIFIIDKIIKFTDGKQIAILKGIAIRLEADAPIEDLMIADKDEIKRNKNEIENDVKNELKNKNIRSEKQKRIQKKIQTGLILHLDGDKRYSEKSARYYKKLGLRAIVRNVPENKQPKVVYKLLNYYNPDILIITGHDGMIKKETSYNDIYNYKNSRHFIETVKEARKYDEETRKGLVIFAGACQSYFEAIILAGANFASSPARILIDFLDPLILAKKVATTDEHVFITIEDFEKDLRDGKKGISGIGAKGKKSIIFI
ncbi:MAG: sporulation peptidase YabG [Clostridia bacterium]|nr:sporulation peptidase YabG [Clostridia bacterium]